MASVLASVLVSQVSQFNLFEVLNLLEEEYWLPWKKGTKVDGT